MRYTFVIAFICVFVLGLVVGWYLGNDTRAPAPIFYDLSDTSSALTYYIASDMTRVVELSAGKDEFIRRLILQDEGTIQDRASRATELVEAFASTHGASLRMRALVIDLLHLAGQFDQALAWIKEADILASDLEEDELVGQLLDSVTESYASELLFLERFDVLDELYEEITYVMPERVRYFFKLGMLRIQMGNYEGAMMPLSQIQNSHGFIGT